MPSGVTRRFTSYGPNTAPQMENCLADIFDLSPEEVDPYTVAMQETQEAIQRVLGGRGQWILRRKTLSSADSSTR